MSGTAPCPTHRFSFYMYNFVWLCVRVAMCVCVCLFIVCSFVPSSVAVKFIKYVQIATNQFISLLTLLLGIPCHNIGIPMVLFLGAPCRCCCCSFFVFFGCKPNFLLQTSHFFHNLWPLFYPCYCAYAYFITKEGKRGAGGEGGRHDVFHHLHINIVTSIQHNINLMPFFSPAIFACFIY